ncbi:uncharacterized protein [Euphorbia lathyris]|uniref:uncharacterized protein n=1 Tax=Euphorbia lathyris TaxID=212925 RepID=UPI0033138F50
MATVEDAKTSSNPQIIDIQTPEMSPYERSREERIKANLERMQKLGISDLSLKLKSLTSPPKRTKRTYTKRASPLPPLHPSPSEPRRRSSRLQTSTPVSYSEAVMAKKSGPIEEEYVTLEEGAKPEVYTEEHEKLLGSTEKSWTLFVDGYGADGKRIYDPIKGKTCHQCRQKTLGYRTHCSQCELVQGQFCGDCLYMRYGEHVLEAIENPDWICPPCRGICNCSLCRNGKGWTPTGMLYKKISRMGYKSVAHYLIQTQRAQNTEEKNSVTINQATAKRSLPFTEMETPTELKTGEEKQLPDSTTHTDKENELEFNVKEEKEVQDYDNSKIAVEIKLERRHEEKQLPDSTTYTNKENELEFNVKEEKEVQDYDNGKIAVEIKLERRREEKQLPDSTTYTDKENELEFNVKEEKEVQDYDNCKIAVEIKLERRRALVFEQSPERESIGARLRKRHTKIDGELTDMNEKSYEVKRENEAREYANDSWGIVLESIRTPEKRTECDTEPNADSISGRLRQRRRMNKD